MQKNREVIWSTAAEIDFELILDYLQNKWSNKGINKFIDKVEDCIELIKDDHYIFPLINKDLKIRKCVVTKQNTIYYREKSNTIEIVRLFDSRQNPKLRF